MVRHNQERMVERMADQEHENFNNNNLDISNDDDGLTVKNNSYNYMNL